MLNSTLTNKKRPKRVRKPRKFDSANSSFNNVIISQEIQPYQLESHKLKFDQKGTIERYLNFLKSIVNKKRIKSIEAAIKTRNQIVFNNCKKFAPVYDNSLIKENTTATLEDKSSSYKLPQINFTEQSPVFKDLSHKFNRLYKKIEHANLVTHVKSEQQSVDLYDVRSPLAYFYDNLTYRKSQSDQADSGLAKDDLGVLSFDSLSEVDKSLKKPSKNHSSIRDFIQDNRDKLLDSSDFVEPVPLHELVDNFFNELDTTNLPHNQNQIHQPLASLDTSKIDNFYSAIDSDSLSPIQLIRDQNDILHMLNENETNNKQDLERTETNILQQITISANDLKDIYKFIAKSNIFKQGYVVANDQQFTELKNAVFGEKFPQFQFEKLNLSDFIKLLDLIKCVQKIEIGYIVFANNKKTRFFRGKVSLINSGAGFIEQEDANGKFSGKKSDVNLYVPQEYIEFYNLHNDEIVFCVVEEERVKGSSEYYSRYSFIFYRYQSLIEKVVTSVHLDPKDQASVCFVKKGQFDIPQYLKVPAEFNDLSGSMLAVVSVKVDCEVNFKNINTVNLFNEPELALSFDSSYELTQVFNSDSEFENQIDSILVKFDLNGKFPTEVKKAVKQFPLEVGSYDPKVRKDLTHLDFVTIDGEDARDFDDAVYVERNPTGYKLYVAIADVSYYVRDLDVIDQEARERTTSIYFPTRVIPMLPEELSNGLCSLNPNVERFSLVCEMQISKTGDLVAHTFYEACIVSKKRFTYNIVQNIIDNDFTLEADYTNEKLNELVKDLYSCFKTLERNKKSRGAINIDTSEPKFKFDEKGEVIDIYFEDRKEAHKLIEEMMVVANQAAAQFVYNHNVPAPHRNHAMPDPERVERLNCLLAAYNLALPTYPTSYDYRVLSEQIARLANKETIYANVLRSLPRALYEADSSGHFGLALEKYAQFTSPIRRYPDLLLHRSIKSIIFNQKEVALQEGGYAYSIDKMTDLCERCSDNEFNVDRAYFDFMDWVKCSFMMKFLGKPFIGIISTVTRNGFFVTIPEYQIDGFVSDSNGLLFDMYDIVPGSKIKVVLSSVKLQERKIDFTIASDIKTKGGYSLQTPKSNRRKNNKKSKSKTSKKESSKDTKSTTKKAKK